MKLKRKVNSSESNAKIEHDVCASYIQGLNAIIEHVKDPLAVVRLKRGDVKGKLICASGGARELFPQLDPVSGSVESFLRLCDDADALPASEAQWKSAAGESYRLTLSKLAILPCESLRVIRFSPIKTPAACIGHILQAAQNLGLTPCESKTLELMAQGMSNMQIAKARETSYHTVRAHFRKIFTKLNVSNRVEAVTAVSRQPSTK